jgi:hypothetical protein
MNVMHKLPIVSSEQSAHVVEIQLNAAVVAIDQDSPRFLANCHREATGLSAGLPSGSFLPTEHPSLEFGLRASVLELTGVELGYVEQLYTFDDLNPRGRGLGAPPPTVALGYMALTQAHPAQPGGTCQWLGTYDYLPYEDWREGRPTILSEEIEPHLKAWAAKPLASDPADAALHRFERARIAFGLEGAPWDEERVLDRFELLSETGFFDMRKSATPPPMSFLDRRIVASALGRLRAKIKYRPVLFELMAPEFTLFELQRTVEAILGSRLHKQNFRRLVESGGLVDATTDVRNHTGGRPAKLFRFRREVLLERPSPGVRVRSGLAA